MNQAPPAGSATAPTCASSINTSWTLRAWRLANAVGSPSGSVKAPRTTASAPPAAAPNPASVSRSMLVQTSRAASMRADERASITAGVLAPQASLIRAQTMRAARTLAIVRKCSASAMTPRVILPNACSIPSPACVSALA